MADLTVTAANVLLVSGTARNGTAGETITAGQSIYLKSADSELYRADCDNTAATSSAVGIALNGASNGQPLSYAGNGCVVNMGATVTIGGRYFVSGTEGGVAPSTDLATDDYVVQLGIGITAANLKVQIINSGVQVPA